MRTPSAAAVSALSAGTVALAQLVRLDLATPLFFNTSGWHLRWGEEDDVYIGTAGVGRIDPIVDQPGEITGLSFQMSGITSDMLSLALAEPVQGKPIYIYTAIFSQTTFEIIDAETEWTGRIDVMAIRDNGSTCDITVTAEHVGIDLLRPSNVRYTNQDQRAIDGSDLGFQYVADQADQELVWPSRSYFFR